MIFTFDPLAKREYEDAFQYYEAQDEGSGEKFRSAMWAAIAILRRFPYKLIYSAADDGVYIIAVAHGHREPDYWVDRA